MTVTVEFVGGPIDGEIRSVAEISPLIVMHGLHHEIVYQLALDHGRPSRTDEGLIRYLFRRATDPQAP